MALRKREKLKEVGNTGTLRWIIPVKTKRRRRALCQEWLTLVLLCSCLSKDRDQTKEGRQSGLWEQERSVGLISLLSSPPARYAPRHSRKPTKASQRRYIQTQGMASHGIIDSSALAQRHHTNHTACTHKHKLQSQLRSNLCAAETAALNPHRQAPIRLTATQKGLLYRLSVNFNTIVAV